MTDPDRFKLGYFDIIIPEGAIEYRYKSQHVLPQSKTITLEGMQRQNRYISYKSKNRVKYVYNRPECITSIVLYTDNNGNVRPDSCLKYTRIEKS